jgi:two-component system, chemotaxis family, CheB/CheR fusion protein
MDGKCPAEFLLPACVVTDEKFNVLYVQGHTSDYLESPTGEMTSNVVKMAREGLKVKLSVALRKAMKQKAQVQLSPSNTRLNQVDRAIRLTVKPFFGALGGQTLILIVFEDLHLESKAKKVHAADTIHTQQRSADRRA